MKLIQNLYIQIKPLIRKGPPGPSGKAVLVLLPVWMPAQARCPGVLVASRHPRRRSSSSGALGELPGAGRAGGTDGATSCTHAPPAPC